MKQQKYIRKDRVVTNLGTAEVTRFEFINEAKRHSRELQVSEDGALGRGTLRVA